MISLQIAAIQLMIYKYLNFISIKPHYYNMIQFIQANALGASFTRIVSSGTINLALCSSFFGVALSEQQPNNTVFEKS